MTGWRMTGWRWIAWSGVGALIGGAGYLWMVRGPAILLDLYGAVTALCF